MSDDWNKLKHLVDLSAENARLKEEVKRLEAVIESYKDSGIRIFAMMDEERRNTSHLKAEVESLRKAGDLMAEALSLNDDVFDNQEKKEAQAAWIAAKEGKPHA